MVGIVCAAAVTGMMALLGWTESPFLSYFCTAKFQPVFLQLWPPIDG
jgi:hypothetical protein